MVGMTTTSACVVCSLMMIDTSTPWTSTLSLHDALPIFEQPRVVERDGRRLEQHANRLQERRREPRLARRRLPIERDQGADPPRSEEHTSELQSRVDLVCRLLLEKKKNNEQNYQNLYQSI